VVEAYEEMERGRKAAKEEGWRKMDFWWAR
jgi:hypothetical protein